MRPECRGRRIRRSPAEFSQDIVRTLDDLCAVLQQRMRAAVPATQDAAGHRHHVATLLERVSRRNERTAPFRCFDDDNGQRDPTDQTIPQREVLRKRRAARAQLADQNP